jgi:hypothetical protein
MPQWDAIHNICLLEIFLFFDIDFTESAPSIHEHLDEPREATFFFQLNDIMNPTCRRIPTTFKFIPTVPSLARS